MNNTEDIPIKIIIFIQSIITIVAYILIQYFFSPQSKGLWWLPGTYLENLFWGILGALILIIPIYLYINHRSTQLLKALEPLLPLCHQPVLILILISILAGLGEELLFRAFIQEFLGIWWTAFIFLLPHIGLPLNLPNILDRFLLTGFYLGAGLVLGILAREIGLIAAITAHSLYDFSAFFLIKAKYTTSSLH